MTATGCPGQPSIDALRSLRVRPVAAGRRRWAKWATTVAARIMSTRDVRMPRLRRQRATGEALGLPVDKDVGRLKRIR